MSRAVRLLNWKPGRELSLVLAALPFVLLIVVYLIASDARRAANPDDKLLPSAGAMAEAMGRMAFEEDRRTGQRLLWVDTGASLKRLAQGLAIAAVVGLTLGVVIGLLPVIGTTLGPFVAAVSMVPPLAILPILFILLGLGELSKVALIAIGVAPFLVRDVAFRVRELPRELLVKAQTLGATTLQIAVRVVVPQVLPRLLAALRLAIGPAWLFLIAAEAIASTEGLGYRVFLVRRFLAMDVILPYVLWITFLAYLMDAGLHWLQQRLFPWSEGR